jgi:hypothetical protein
MQAPCLGTLGTGIGDETPFFMESEYLDAGFGGIEHPGGLVGTGHLALQTTGALFRFYLKRFEHLGISLFTLFIIILRNTFILYGIIANMKPLKIHYSGKIPVSIQHNKVIIERLASCVLSHAAAHVIFLNYS